MRTLSISESPRLGLRQTIIRRLEYGVENHPKMIDLVIVVDVDVCLLELAGRDVTSEEDINLSVRSILHLGNLEVGYDKADQRGRTPNVAAFTTNCNILAIFPRRLRG